MDEEFITPIRRLDEETLEKGNGSPPVRFSETPRSPIFEAPPPQLLDNTNRHFKGQQKNETVHCFCRKHWIVIFPYLLGFVAVAILTLSLLFFWADDLARQLAPPTYRITMGILILALTFGLHRFFTKLLNYYLQIIIITNFRVIVLEQTLFFTSNRDSIDLPEIQDIVVRRDGILKTLLNYGEIIITLSSAHATKVLYCVPNPEYHFQKINKTKREYITFRRTEKAANLEIK